MIEKDQNCDTKIDYDQISKNENFGPFHLLRVYDPKEVWLIENFGTCIFLDWDVLFDQNRF